MDHVRSSIEYEQEIVEWIDETQVSLCPSCTKTFGFSRRKHHCRLDGYVICNECSQFLPFSMARKLTRSIDTANTLSWCCLGYLIEPNASSSSRVTSNGVTRQRSNSLTSVISTTTADDSRDGGGNVDYLRICLSCRQILQRHYNHISFKNPGKDEIFLHYEVRICLFVHRRPIAVLFRLENCRSQKGTFQYSSNIFSNCGISSVSNIVA
jgi:hypothetical protein